MGLLSRRRSARARRRASGPIAGAEQLAQETGLPLLIEAPGNALAGPAERGGRWPSLSRAQIETARTLVGKIDALTSGKRPRSLFVADGIASVDGVAPAIAVATASALEGRRTLLVDCDFKHRGVAPRLALVGGPGIGDYLNRAAVPREMLQPLDLGGAEAQEVEGPGGLVFIAAGGGSASPMPAPTWDRFRHFIAKVTKAYDFVVVAGEPLLAPSEPSQLMPLLDATILCARPSAVTHGQALQAGATLRRWMPRTVGLVAAAG